MREDTQQAFAVEIRWEGGWTESPAEPGGASNWGVSMVTFGDYRKKHGLPPPTFDDLKALTQQEAVDLYAEMWSPRINFDLLPVGVDLRVLDISINLGVVGGISLLQKTIDVPVNGKMDGVTMLALRAFSAPDRAAGLCAALGTAWLLVKSQSPNWYKYKAGWTNRAVAVTNSCLDMINSSIGKANTAPAQGNT